MASAVGGPSWELKAIHHVLVVCSMFLSGYFGWTIGEGVFPLNLILAFLCATVAFGVATMFRRGAEYDQDGYRFAAYRCWIIGTLFLIANMIFDYSSAAALREQVAVAAQNQNTKADDKRSAIEREKAAIAKLKSEKAWQAPLLSPSAYDAEITNLKGHMIYKRSKGCADQTLAETFEHCKKIASAEADKANAERRMVISEEIKAREAELKTLEEQSGETQHAANPALAQIKMLGSWFTWTRNPSEAQAFWVQNSVMLVMSILVNLGLAYLGHELGSSTPRRHAEPEPQEHHGPMAGRNILTDERPPEARASDPPPIPLRPAPASTATVNIIADPARRTLTADEFARLMGIAQDAIEQAKRKA